MTVTETGDLHFGTSLVALRALAREIIPNTSTMHIQPPTCLHDRDPILIDCSTRLRAFGAQPPSE